MAETRQLLCVVVPCYNEAEVLGLFYEALKPVLDSLPDLAHRILFVDDGSEDGTLAKLNELAARDACVRVYSLSRNYGHQVALTAGLDAAEGDAVLVMDADLQHPPALVPELVARHEEGHDVVYTVREDTAEVPLLKRLTARWFYRLASAISDTPIREGAADFRLVSRRVVEVFQRSIRERGLFLRGLFVWVGFPACPVRFRAGARRAGRTKYSMGRMVRFALGGVVAFSRVPLRTAALVGLLVCGLGLLAGTVAAWGWLRQGSPPEWSVALAIFGLVSGSQLIFLGVLGEYLGAVLDEVRARPHYVVEERINL